MSKPTLIKKSFNGGELSPYLHYRDDLTAYSKGCKELKNFSVTPYGAVTKRKPLEQIVKLDVLPIRYLPFKFSTEEIFHIVFYDAGVDGVRVQVFDDDGNIQDLDSDSNQYLDTPYAVSDVDNVQYMQVNDFIYLTHGDYPVYIINRYYDDTAEENLWKFEEFEINLGPFDTVNQDATHLLSINVPQYDETTTYNAGDIVMGEIETNATIDVKAIHWHMHSPTSASAIVECTAPHGLSGGDTITLIDCSHDVRWVSSVIGTGSSAQVRLSDPKNVNMDKTYAVVSVLSPNTIEVNEWLEEMYFSGTNNIGHPDNLVNYTALGTTSSLTAYYNRSANVSGSFTASSTGLITGSFVSQVDGNIGNDLSDSAYWVVGGSTIGTQVSSASLVSNKNLFSDSDIGRLVGVKDQADERLNSSWSADAVSNPINAYGTVTLKTEGGAWSGLLELQQSTDGLNNWETIGSIRSVNGGTNGSIEREVIGTTSALRVRLTDWSNPSGVYETKKCVWSITTTNSIYQIFKIIEYIDPQTVNVTPITPLLTAISTSNWKLGEFSQSTGYPKTIAGHNERMILGGTDSKPNTVWASRINDWQDYILDDLSTSPFSFTVASDSYDSIKWMKSAKNLMIGTDNNEITMSSRNSEEALTATNVDVNSNTSYGSASIQAVKTADTVFYIDGQRRIVRSSSYDFASDQYQSINLSEFAEHITESGIKEVSHMRHPYSTVFFNLYNDNACIFTYDRLNEVKGWSQFETNGSIISAQSNYGANGDVVTAIIHRSNGYMLERYDPNSTNEVYLDNQVAVSISGHMADVSDVDMTDRVVVMGDRLLEEGVDYSVTGDGNWLMTVAGSGINLGDGELIIGLPYECVINPTDMNEYSATGNYKRLTKLSLYLLDSGDAKIYINGKESPFTDALRLSPNERLNGDSDITTGGGYDGGIDVKIVTQSHRPFTLLGMGYRLTT